MYQPHHVAISVTNRERSIAFYELLDFRKVHEWHSDDNSLTITHLLNGNMILELFCFTSFQRAPNTIYDTKTDLPVIGTKHFGLKVDSIEAAREDLAAKLIIEPDIEIVQGRTGPRYFFIKDPDGILVEIAEDKRSFTL